MTQTSSILSIIGYGNVSTTGYKDRLCIRIGATGKTIITAASLMQEYRKNGMGDIGMIKGVLLAWKLWSEETGRRRGSTPGLAESRDLPES